MDAGVSSARQARSQHRHELRTLTYVTIDQANGGVVRNLTRDGFGAQVVAAVRPKQQLRVRFELRYPRLRVETRAEVVWATFSGQCGIRFLDLAPGNRRQIQEWIFGDLLEAASVHAGEMFAEPARELKEDGLMVSASPLKVIELPLRETAPPTTTPGNAFELDWLSQPLSARGLVWTVNTLTVFAGLLLFVLVFLAVNREAPPWPLAMTAAAAFSVAAMYWGFFRVFGGGNLGERLARMACPEQDAQDDGARFR